MMILKIVGYAENVVRYYRLDDFKAHVWLAHQRYPTRGRVWHPGGSHPSLLLMKRWSITEILPTTKQYTNTLCNAIITPCF